jgi:DNA (cytosine-5)-methyltransferase 1
MAAGDTPGVLEPIAFAQNQRHEVRDLNDCAGALAAEPGMKQQTFLAEPIAIRADTTIKTTEGDVCHTLRVGVDDHVMTLQMAVRRLTPVECARLQGFPDHHARIPWRKKAAEDCPDGPQYKAFGNSMAVSVIAWIGRRIQEVIA